MEEYNKSSMCCNAKMIEETDICSKCIEHTVTNEEYDKLLTGTSMTFYRIWNLDEELGTVSAPNAETAYKRALFAFPDATHVEEV